MRGAIPPVLGKSTAKHTRPVLGTCIHTHTHTHRVVVTHGKRDNGRQTPPPDPSGFTRSQIPKAKNSTHGFASYRRCVQSGFSDFIASISRYASQRILAFSHWFEKRRKKRGAGTIVALFEKGWLYLSILFVLTFPAQHSARDLFRISHSQYFGFGLHVQFPVMYLWHVVGWRVLALVPATATATATATALHCTALQTSLSLEKGSHRFSVFPTDNNNDRGLELITIKGYNDGSVLNQ
ncbi:hypothetical protein T440DRAFT_463633 [Plenodomus tracheiphilus IPT5]|uniref:Uncharacterized protein n=1 Tax=Plenodomus tracheiphilus IPT5 TaxID=1408161 RepID=A0A6A7BM96_9PLEO|nr:hypothetical protein T440DRAFT_463633 [Plenodomus tracheiphilus IPT5]